MAGSRECLIVLVLVMLSAMAGCGPVFVGGKYAVATYSREAAEKVTPRVVIFFYDEQDRSHWGEAVGPQAAKGGITYPTRCFWRWGAAEAYGWRSYFIFPGVCVLADGSWPSIITASRYPYRSDLPEARWPGLAERGTKSVVGMTEPIPAGCDGIWRVLVLPLSHPYDELAQSHTLSAYPGVLPAVDVALTKSKTLSPGDKAWAYGQLLHMVKAQLQIEKHASSRSDLERWEEVFLRHATK